MIKTLLLKVLRHHIWMLSNSESASGGDVSLHRFKRQAAGRRITTSSMQSEKPRARGSEPVFHFSLSFDVS